VRDKIELPDTEAYNERKRLEAEAARDPNVPSRYITPEQQREMWEAYLELGSFTQVAKKLGRDRETVARHIKCPEFDQFALKAREDAGKAVMAVMSKRAIDYGDHWFEASREAASKGDHRPAKDALTALGIIKPDTSGTAQQGFIVVNGYMPNGQALPDPFSASPAKAEPTEIVEAEQ
jgi:hypothetical protein